MAFNDDEQLEGLAAIIEGACKVPSHPHPDFVNQTCHELRELLVACGHVESDVDYIVELFRSRMASASARLVPREHGTMTFRAAVTWLTETGRGEKLKPPHVVREEHRRRVRCLIRAEFNGRNVAELAERFSVHRSTVYRYLRSPEPDE